MQGDMTMAVTSNGVTNMKCIHPEEDIPPRPFPFPFLPSPAPPHHHYGHRNLHAARLRLHRFRRVRSLSNQYDHQRPNFALARPSMGLMPAHDIMLWIANTQPPHRRPVVLAQRRWLWAHAKIIAGVDSGRRNWAHVARLFNHRFAQTWSRRAG